MIEVGRREVDARDGRIRGQLCALPTLNKPRLWYLLDRFWLCEKNKLSPG